MKTKSTLTGTALFLAGLGAGTFIDTEAPKPVAPPPAQAIEITGTVKSLLVDEFKNAEAQGTVTCALKQFANKPEPLCYCQDSKSAGWLSELEICAEPTQFAMTQDGRLWRHPAGGLVGMDARDVD